MRKRARSLFLALVATLSLIVVPAGAAGTANRWPGIANPMAAVLRMPRTM